MGASINQVYNTVKRIANKEQRGFIKPTEFNTFAPLAQREVFEELMSVYKSELGLQNRGLGFLKDQFGGLQAVRDNLRPLAKYGEILSSTSGGSANEFDYPSDYAYYINIYHTDDIGVDRSADVIMPDQSQSLSASTVLGPTDEFPVSIMGRTIEFLPDSISGDVYIDYYKTPQGVSVTTGNPVASDPIWAYSNPFASSVETYNPTNSIDFELPVTCTNFLVIKILSYVGINLREAELVAYAEQEQAQQKVEQ